MASAIYPKAKESFLSQNPSIDMDTDTINVALIDTGTYTYSAAHDFWDDAVAGLVGSVQALGSKTVTSGVFDAADTTFTSVSGATVEALIIYKSTGVNSTSPLIAYIDTGTGFPVTPNGGNIVVTWDSGANKIFAL